MASYPQNPGGPYGSYQQPPPGYSAPGYPVAPPPPGFNQFGQPNPGGVPYGAPPPPGAPVWQQPGHQPYPQQQPMPNQPTVIHVQEQQRSGVSSTECCLFALCAFCCGMCCCGD